MKRFIIAVLLVLLATSAWSVHAGQALLQEDQSERLWLIWLAEPGAYESGNRAPGGTPDSADRAQLTARMMRLRDSQAQTLQSFEQRLGRDLQVLHRYLLSHSGFSVRLTAAEAAELADLPAVSRIKLDQSFPTLSDQSVPFVGADSIWDGNWSISGLSARGEGRVAGVLDSGIVLPHPSFNDDPACGHGVDRPGKVLSMVDCSSTDTLGRCDGPDPLDSNGHGSLVAGIMAGNRVDATSSPPPPLAPGSQALSGVAPCASLRIYKTCPGSACPQSHILAGMNHLLLDGDVDVMNFSIAGGTSPWLDNDRIKLDLIEAGTLVVAAAGNTTATNTVNHRAPWLLSVGASTHSGQTTLAISASAPEPPAIPETVRNLATSRGSASPDASPLTGLALRRFAQQLEIAEGCTPGEDGVPADMPAFPDGFFDSAAALIRRGGCADVVKISNAALAGAELILLRNVEGNSVNLITTGQVQVPAYLLASADGNALGAFVDQHPDTARIDLDLRAGDVMSLISIAGPIPEPYANLTKPDLTAPGVAIVSAGIGTGSQTWSARTGTSMSAPHVAGAALLLRQLHPYWSVIELQSALMLAARPDGWQATHLPWTADNGGSGRLDIPAAARAGLLMDEARQTFLAADPEQGGDLRLLNLPNLRDVDCTPQCTWTRTLSNRLPGPSSWTVSVDTLSPDLIVEVVPESFNFSGLGVPPAIDSLFFAGFELPSEPESITLSITARPVVDYSQTAASARILLTEAAGRSSALRLGVMVRGRGDIAFIDVQPEQLSASAMVGGAVQSVPLTISNLGFAELVWELSTEPTRAPLSLGLDDPNLGQNPDHRAAPLLLQLDDGTAENAIGAGITPMLWLNRFTPEAEAFPVILDRVQVYFNSTVAIGNRFDIVFYSDADGDPGNGADFVAQVTDLSVSAVGQFMEVVLPAPVSFETPGDILIALVTRQGMFANNRLPAALDQTPPRRQRSWIGLGDLSSPPQLPLASFGEIGTFSSPGGNWLLRATGTSSLPVPACSEPGAVPWLQVSETNGTVAPDSAQMLSVELDPAGLEPGTYSANLCISSNDQSQPLVVVPVALTVEPSIP